MTAPDMNDGEHRAPDEALASEVESAFDDVRVELGGDPQADLDGQEGTDSPTSTTGDDPGQSGSGSGEAASGAGAAPSDGENDPLAQAQAATAQAQEELARARADLYNLHQEYQGFVRRSREAAAGHREAGAQSVAEALIPVLDEIELARTHGDLTGPFEAIALKLETILGEKFSLVRYGAVGEPFEPQVHEALMAVESGEVSEPTVARVLQPGYKLGDKVVRAARVQVANPA